MARLGVLFDAETAEYRWRYGVDLFQSYIGEILSRRGIPFEWFRSAAEAVESNPDILIAALSADEHETNELLWNYAEKGGRLVAYGGLDGLAAKIGYMPGERLGAGYAMPVRDYVECGLDRPWRFLHGSLWIRKSTEGTAVRTYGAVRKHTPAGEAAGPLLIRAQAGQGMIERWTVDIPRTVVTFQQGSGPVVTDGIPAPDGTADVRDGVLKADDVYDMDWDYDRIRTETGMPLFAFPYADWWRDQLIGHLLHTAREAGLSLPFLGYWPEGVDDVALISHDSDYNQDEHAESTLRILAEHDVRSTWCMLEPGYSKAIYAKVRAAGHELAFHYNAVHADNGFWDENEFKRQFAWLKEALDGDPVYTNKNHLTRVEGWGELFRWCEACGIESDQSRGGSKRGNLGFLYGTCQPYYPIARYDEKNRLYNVLEVAFLTPDMNTGKWCDDSIIEPLLKRIKEVHGVAHFLFHQIHLHRLEPVRRAFAKTVRTAREMGFTFWTGQEILQWEKRRRQAVWHANDLSGGRPPVEAPAGTIVWLPLAGDESSADAEGTATFYGLTCRKFTIK
jgi:peptidoglycan/xylan/chitin deacetylase (PgdA/CDA1 family)